MDNIFFKILNKLPARIKKMNYSRFLGLAAFLTGIIAGFFFLLEIIYIDSVHIVLIFFPFLISVGVGFMITPITTKSIQQVIDDENSAYSDTMNKAPAAIIIIIAVFVLAGLAGTGFLFLLTL